ncbi:hypothetical protein HNQ69_001047 [Bartonella callosciuri]|uniref:Uncharacterized protein n=1 Tax=Bartonella callosciuri TaxID=686223 RepID=A0A840NQW0_9HYPH|nr:hypothetical protein [Bartonella callosciuri]
MHQPLMLLSVLLADERIAVLLHVQCADRIQSQAAISCLEAIQEPPTQKALESWSH